MTQQQTGPPCCMILALLGVIMVIFLTVVNPELIWGLVYITGIIVRYYGQNLCTVLVGIGLLLIIAYHLFPAQRGESTASRNAVQGPPAPVFVPVQRYEIRDGKSKAKHGDKRGSAALIRTRHQFNGRGPARTEPVYLEEGTYRVRCAFPDDVPLTLRLRYADNDELAHTLVVHQFGSCAVSLEIDDPTFYSFAVECGPQPSYTFSWSVLVEQIV